MEFETTSAGLGNYSVLDLVDTTRLAVLVTPRGRGSFRQQAQELLELMQAVLHEGTEPATVTAQTVFLRDAGDQEECKRLFWERYRAPGPLTTFVIQPPCSGAALAVEAWAIKGRSVKFEQLGSQTRIVEYDGICWVYCGAVAPEGRPMFEQTTECFEQLRRSLHQAGSSFDRVLRTWLYVGGIGEMDGSNSRYHEVNRARTDFYRAIHFGRSLPIRNGLHELYPASTGIGMHGRGMVMSCLAMETERSDVFVLPLENPQQTSAYAYDSSYSPQSPKFSRAMALVAGNYVTTWISGTASIVKAETRHFGDVEAQTEQTIENIERLIAPENFSRHGVAGTGASLSDLAKVRVYLKHPEDFAKCRAICERRLGGVPALYIVADICRPELLVEIEGVAFSKCAVHPC